jgi:putative PEP-CTERM system TPR-repeat lipoprotein
MRCDQAFNRAGCEGDYEMILAVNKAKWLKFRAILYIAVLQLILSACTIGKDEKETLASANNSYESGNYSKAIIELKQLLQNNAENMDARELLARSYLKKGDGISAEKEISKVSAGKSSTADAQLILISSWELQGKNEEIIKTYENGEFDNIDPLRLWDVVARAYLNEKQLEKGAALARKILEKDKNSVTALRSLAKAAVMRKDDSEAMEYLQQAFEIDEKDYKTWRDLGALHVVLEDHNKAVELLKGALSLIGENDPEKDAYNIRVNLIHLFFHLKQLDESEVYIRELETRYKQNPYIDYLSGLYDYLKQDYEKAVIKLNRVHSVMPNHLPTMLLLGAVNFSENNLEQANVLLTRYVNQVPTHLQARKLLGEIKLRLDKPKEALALLESGDVDKKDDQILAMIGLAASQSGEYSKGVEFLKKAADANPSDTRIREELAQLYISHGSFDEAINELEGQWKGKSSKRDTLLILSYIKKQDFDSARKLSDQLLARDGGGPKDLYVRAMIELSSGNRSAARQYFTDAINKSSDFTPGQLALARMDLEDGRLNDASDRLNRVIAKEPNNVNAMMLLAQLSERAGNQNAALEWLDKAVEKGQDSWLPRVILARYYLRRKQPEKAATYLDEEKLRESANPAIISLLAIMDQQAGNYNEAESAIKKMLDNDPRNEAAYLQLADLQTKKGDIKAARNTLQRLDREIPSSYKGKLLAYKLEMRERNYQQAEAIIKQLLEDDKTKLLGVTLQATYQEAKGDLVKAIKNLEAHASSQAPFVLVQQLSDLYVKNNDSKSAIDLLSNWKKSHKNNQQVLLALAIVYQTSGNADEALTLYRELLELNPRNLVALNNSALLNFERDPKRALEQAKLAYEISGNASQSVIDTFAWLTHKSGDTATALKLLTPIMDKASDPSILYHYAVMLANSDKVKEAKEVLVTITKEPADFPESEEARKLLSEISQDKG